MMVDFNCWTIRILIICVIAFILQSVIPGFTEEFVLNSSLALERPWTFITSMFLHGSFTHIFYNMFALVMFGLILESLIGDKKFITIYMISGLVASIGAFIFYDSSLGASGAIYGIMGVLGILRPKMVIWFAGVPMPMAIAVILWALGDFVGLFAPGEVAYAAHLFGLAAGLIFGIIYRKRFGENIRKNKIDPLSGEEVRKWEDRWLK